MKKITFMLSLIALLVAINSCCSIQYPKYEKKVEAEQMKIIAKIFDNPKYLEKITVDTSLSSESFYENINRIGIDNYLDKLNKVDCDTKFIKLEQNAIKTADSSFKQANIYYFQQKTDLLINDILFIFINTNKKWYLDELVIKNQE